MNIVITGGCGFIGINLIKSFISIDEKDIRIIDNLSIGSLSELDQITNYKHISVDDISSGPLGIEFLKEDILNIDSAIKATKGCDIIIHLAANTGVDVSIKNPRKDLVTNVIGTFNYLEAARINKIKKFIFASSGAVIGEVEPPIHEQLAAHPISPYGASKQSAEAYCSAYHHAFGIDTVCLRFSNVYGPGSHHKMSVVSQFIKSAINYSSVKIFGDGSQTRDFLFIDDLVSAIIISAEKPNIGGETFQIASGKEVAINELLYILIPILEKRLQKTITISNEKARVGDMKRNFSSCLKAKEKLCWKAKTNLEEGLLKTLTYFI